MNNSGHGSEAAGFCAELVRTHDFVRYASTLLVPAAERRALLALYAFNVEISRVRVQVSQPLPGEVRLQWWTDMLAGQGYGGIEGNPVAAELLRTVKSCRLPVDRLTRLITEHQFDLYNDPMPTMPALEGYLNDTASALFSIAAMVVAMPSEAIEHLARHAGLAQGMAQVMASLPFDASRRQLYFPLQVLVDDGRGIEEVFAGRQTPKSRAALDQFLDVVVGTSRRPLPCSRPCHRRCAPSSCRWRWSDGISNGCPATIPLYRERHPGFGYCGRYGERPRAGVLA